MTTSNSIPPQPVRARRGLRLGHWALVLFAAMSIVAVLEAASIFRLNRQASEVRDLIGLAVSGETSTQVQFSVGSGVLGLARFVVGFIDDVPAEALRAMAAVDSASVGVYRLHETPSIEERIAIMNRTAENMTEDGWYRVVAVHDDDELVMIFAPDADMAAGNLQLCIVVCDQNDLVVVSARGDVEPLRDIAAMHTAQWRQARRSRDRAVL